ncbi:hypothetical protein F5B20DRAFT_532933 [Whalleya microplaca]|nr:hypothetical protein F5B20DRAFT_532933 [Whalleya microplaca]
MTVARCTGFTHPLILLYRSSLPLRQSTRAAQGSQWLRSTSRTGHRSFMTCRVLCAKQNPKVTSPPPPAPAGMFRPMTLQRSPLNYIQQLADKSSATTLYEAAPQRGFPISSYAAGLTCIAGAGLNSWVNVYNIPEGIHSLVPVAFGVVSLVMAALGTKFALMPAYNIRSIKVLPFPRSATRKSQTAASLPPVRLEITARRNLPIPGLPFQRIEVDPSAVVMKVPMFHRKSGLTDSEKARLKKEEEIERKRQREYEMTHIMSAPFRHMASAMSTLFASLRQGLTGEGFAPIYIDGIRYKLDITEGYALEQGRALDRIVRIERDPALDKLIARSR